MRLKCAINNSTRPIAQRTMPQQHRNACNVHSAHSTQYTQHITIQYNAQTFYSSETYTSLNQKLHIEGIYTNRAHHNSIRFVYTRHAVVRRGDTQASRYVFRCVFGCVVVVVVLSKPSMPLNATRRHTIRS